MASTHHTCGMFSIKLVGASHPSLPACTKAGKPALMNFPDSPEGRRIAASIPNGHRSLVYLMAPRKCIWAAIEYIKWDEKTADVLEEGRQAAQAQNAIALMQVLAPHYAKVWRCVRFLADVTPLEHGLAIDHEFHQGEVIRPISQQEYDDLFNAAPWTWPTASAASI
jgi:hypothetical protein